MREILFRGKTKKGNWAEGWFCGATCDSPHGDAYQSAQLIEKNTLLWLDVIPETVGQYTGLTDKNGKKIFEGDIVRFRTQTSVFKPSFLVMWHEETARFIVAIQDGVRAYPMDKTWKYEIIGNIHDNPNY